MKNWTIGTRIIIGGTTLIALLITVGAIGFFGLKRIERLAADRLRDDAIPGVINMADISTDTLRAHIRALTAGNATTAQEREANITRLNELVADVAKSMDAYEKSLSVPEDRRNFETLKQKRTAYVADRSIFLDFVKAGKQAEADKYAATTWEKTYADYRDHTLMMLKWNEDSAKRATDELVTVSVQATAVSQTVSIVGVVGALAFGWVIVRSINRALKEMALTLDDAANQVASAAGQVSGSSQSLAQGSSEQAASLEETSSSLEELSSMTKRNVDSASNAKTLSGQTRAAADSGNAAMAEMREAMNAIKTSSSDIGKIIKTIDEIAFQTNILALNAAVEAARAGEAGMGFAVVADEVRNLAQRSATSAKETATKIEIAIQNGENGVAISEKVAAALGTIAEKAAQVDALVGEIATASNEQNDGISQINLAVGQMDKVTQSNAANAEETASAAEELSSQSVALKSSVTDLRRLVEGGSTPAAPGTEASRFSPAPTNRLTSSAPAPRGTPPASRYLAVTADSEPFANFS